MKMQNSITKIKAARERTLRKRPDNSICAKQYPEGHVEVIQYSRYELDAYFTPRLQEKYWLYFYNGRLSIGKTPSPSVYLPDFPFFFIIRML